MWQSVQNFVINNAELLIAIYVVGPIAVFAIMLFIATLLAEDLSNDPNRKRPEDFDQRNLGGQEGDEDRRPKSDLPYEVDRFGLFTSLANGRAKIIESSGERFEDVIMNFPGHTFYGLTWKGLLVRRRNRRYWDIVPAGTWFNRELSPIGYWPILSWKTPVFGTYRLAWWAWQKVLYELKGWVFVGPDSFRRVRTYRLEYFLSDETAEEYLLERHVSYSDHFRVEPFQFFVGIGSAETRTLIEVKKVISQLMWVCNPYDAAYGTDDNWGSFISARMSSEATAVVNQLSIENVVALDEAETLLVRLRDRLLDLVADDGPIKNIGFMFNAAGLTIPDRSTKDPEAAKRLAGRAFAQVDADAEIIKAEGDKEATRIRARGDASAITYTANAISAKGAAGVAAAQIEGGVRQVEAAPAGAVVVVGGQSVDPATAALLSRQQQGDQDES